MSQNKMERFTQRARRALKLAQESAETSEHSYIGTEHLLVALMREEGGIAGRVLHDLGLEENQVSELVKDLSRARPRVQGESLDLSPGTKRVLELAVDEARRMGHHYIGTEHLLLGLVRQSEGVAIDVLKQLRVSPEEVRREIRRVLKEAPVQGQTSINNSPLIPIAMATGTWLDKEQLSRILGILESGKITADIAAGMLRVFQSRFEPSSPIPANLDQRLHLVVTEKGSGIIKLDTTIPLDIPTLLNLLIGGQSGSYGAEDDTHKITMDILKDDEDKP